MSDRRSMLKNVEETAEAMRVLNMLTQPILQEIHRREAELCDEKVLERCESDDFKDSSVSKFSFESPLKLTDSPKGTMKSSSFEGASGALPVSPGFCKRKSVWSPGKHVKVVDTESVLRMEKTPVWTPLRKSKARQSLSCNLENLKSPEVFGSASNSSGNTSFTMNSEIEPRTPLKPMVGGYSNQPSLKTSAADESAVSTQKDGNVSESTSVVDSASSIDEGLNVTPKLEVDCESAEISSEKLVDEHAVAPQLCQDISLSTCTEKESGEIQIHINENIQKTLHSPVRCSPVLLQAYGEEVANVRGSIGSPDKLVNLNESAGPVDPSKVLKGVNAYVEVRRGEDDRTGGFRWKLKQLGAMVSDTLNKKVTHVVFQEGLLSTFRKAKQLNICLVSAQWVMACDESFTRVSEENYPIEKLDQYELADPLMKCIRRPKVMSPDLGSGRDDKRLSKRFQKIHRRSMLTFAQTEEKPKIESTSVQLKASQTAVYKSSETDEDQNSDDDDGFLAMLETQVREKAASRLKKEEAEKAVKEFKAQIQNLLSQKNILDDKDVDSSTPLAKIFQTKNASSPSMSSLKSTRKRSTRKTASPATTMTNSLMKNWLIQTKTSLKFSKNGDEQLSLTAEAAVDALSDEILKSMTSPLTESPLKVKNYSPSCSTSSEQSVTPAKKGSKCTPVRGKKTPQSTAKRPNKNKQNVAESQGSKGIMLNWLKSSSDNLKSCSSAACNESPRKKLKTSSVSNADSSSELHEKSDEVENSSQLVDKYGGGVPGSSTTSVDNLLDSNSNSNLDDPSELLDCASKSQRKKRKQVSDCLKTPQRKESCLKDRKPCKSASKLSSTPKAARVEDM